MDEITEHTIGLIIGLILSACVGLVFWKKGYYSKKLEGYKQHVTLLPTLFAFFIYFAVQIIIPLIVYFWVVKSGGSLTHLREAWINLGIMYTTALAVILFSLLASKDVRTGVWNPKHLGQKGIIRSFFVGMVTWVQAWPLVLVVGEFMTLLLLVGFGIAPPDQDQEMIRYLKKFQDHPEILYPLSLAVAFVIPVMEEILFRGFLQNFFTKMFGKIGAIGLTSLFFAALHFTPAQGSTNFLLLPALFLLSCFLGYLYERQGTLTAPIGLHMTFNSLTLLFLLASFHWV